ncbi:MAG: hypothetical protein M0P71_13125 [Melioribacteraceae bacterium]|jgi:hypothetical protein|nr:hypothetical protein [Melioribacteraceae bacterium]
MGTERGRTVLESYKHRAAKEVLASWLRSDFDVVKEAEFSADGWKFISDIATFKDGHVQAFYEVVHKHPIDAKKLGRMQYYCFYNQLELLCHEVDAEWILLQVEKPDRIVDFTFDLNMISDANN